MRLQILNNIGRPDTDILPPVMFAAEYFNVTGCVVMDVRRGRNNNAYSGIAYHWSNCCKVWISPIPYDKPIKVKYLEYFRVHQIPIVPYEIKNWTEALVHTVAHELAHLTGPGHKWRKSRREVYCENKATEVLEAYRTMDGQFKTAVMENEIFDKRVATQNSANIKKAASSKVLRLKELMSKWERKEKTAKTRISTLKRKLKYYENKTQFS